MRSSFVFVPLVLLGITHGCFLQPKSPHTPDIREFSVVASPGVSATAYGAAPISPYVDSGYFRAQWVVTADGPYRVDLYVSNDSELDAQDPSSKEDVHFYHFSCGSEPSATSCQGVTVSTGCRFSTENILSCGTINFDNPGKDISAFLTQIPKVSYILLRACDESMQACVVFALKVEFQ
jgi:hypothetical protein